MARKSSAQRVKKPLAFWNKPLKADFKGLFAGLSGAATLGYAGDWPRAAAKAVEAIAAVGLETEPGELAWVLLRRAMTQAVYDLAAEVADLLEPPKDAAREVGERLDRALDEEEIRLGERVFDRPGELKIVPKVQAKLGRWFEAHGLTEAKARAAAGRLPSYFVFALVEEWRKRSKTYEPIKAAISTPFARAEEREQLWLSYSRWLERQVDQRMFDEAFGLSQVYIPLRAFYERRPDGEAPDEPGRRGSADLVRWVERIVVDLQEAVDAWLEDTDPRKSILILSGGPGSGKSSFARIYAARKARDGGRVLFIPLHLLDVKADLEESVDAFCRQNEMLPGKVLDAKAGEERLLLIFDGLDELSKQGKQAAEAAHDFLRHVEVKVATQNTVRKRLSVLISGRPVAVDSAVKSEFRREGQVLHLLPYHVKEDERRRFTDPNGLLGEDQRQLWWRRFGEATGHPREGMPEEFQRPDLDAITAEPLLNYLVALSHERGKIDFRAEINLNRIYQDLLEAVYERGYAGRRHAAAGALRLEDFELVLEEIALSAWHGDGRTTTVRAIREHFRGSGLDRLLEVFQGGAEAGVTRLLTAFYFRRHGQQADGEDTFEFTHKSFGEYLTARRIIRAVELLHEGYQQWKAHPLKGFDERKILEQWAQIFGPTPIDLDLFAFLCNEVRRRDVESAIAWQVMLGRVTSHMLAHGMPMEKLDPRQPYQQEVWQARNAEEALLALLAACARSTGTLSEIDWANEHSARSWFSQLRYNVKSGISNYNKYLLFLNLKNCNFFWVVLSGADLSGADLSEANLSQADLSEADLSGAKLSRAELLWAALSRADLSGAKLSRANLSGAKLSVANLSGAKLSRANLSGANLSWADLSGARLLWADLSRADLPRADLSGADLSGANLSGADLSGANITPEQLKGTLGIPDRLPEDT